jgi:hypothetical protein
VRARLSPILACRSRHCRLRAHPTLKTITISRDDSLFLLLSICPVDRPETRPLAELYSDVIPAQGSVVDLLVRARNKQTGQPLKPHEIVAQVRSFLYCVTDGLTAAAGVANSLQTACRLMDFACTVHPGLRSMRLA